MWGPGGNPGTVWKVEPRDRLQAGALRQGRRRRSRQHRRRARQHRLRQVAQQLYVSDLETGLIHRLQLDNGTDLGQFDHGVTGRGSFIDAATGEKKSLPAVAFDPASGRADLRLRRGRLRAHAVVLELRRFPAARVGPRRAPGSRQQGGAPLLRRLVEPGARQRRLRQRLRRREAQLASGRSPSPTPAVSTRRACAASFSSPTSSSILPTSRAPAAATRSPTSPSANARTRRSCCSPSAAACAISASRSKARLRSRTKRASSPTSSTTRATGSRQGRYDVGHYDRKDDGQPFLRANASGGVDFGYGYGVEWHIDPKRPDESVWMTGGTLCTPTGPCFSPDINRAEDGSYVGGVQGIPRAALDEIAPEQSAAPYPNAGAPYPATGPLQSYIFDTDKNLDANDTVIVAELTRNDASKIGDISIYEICAKDDAPELVDEQPELVDQPPDIAEPPIVVAPPADDIPDLEIVKTGPVECIAGDICTFTITVTNRGPGVWSGPVQLFDTLPPGALLVNFNPPDWMCTQAGGAVNCTSAWVVLNPGDVLTLTIDVLIPFGIAGPVDNCVQIAWLPGRDPLDPAVILAIEQALNAAGYPVGIIDGVLDVVTQNAIRQFQADVGLPITGFPDQAVIDLLFGGSAGMPGDGNPANDLSCATVNIPALPPRAAACAGASSAGSARARRTSCSRRPRPGDPQDPGRTLPVPARNARSTSGSSTAAPGLGRACPRSSRRFPPAPHWCPERPLSAARRPAAP